MSTLPSAGDAITCGRGEDQTCAYAGYSPEEFGAPFPFDIIKELIYRNRL